MASIQQAARALGDPTRHAVFRFVVDADRPVDVAELTEQFGLNHNAIRQHLARLVEAELIIEDTAPPVGRGRPRLVYEVDPRTESKWGAIGPYERLSLWLVEMVRSGETPVEVGRRAGRRLRLGTGPAEDPVEVLVDQMARQGFDPAVRRRGNSLDVILQTCPFETTAVADPDTVCQLHLGIASGLVEGLDGLEVDELVPKDPRRAHCRLRCHLTEVSGP
jgi:predicted ArsR family transcriptional regulator